MSGLFQRAQEIRNNTQGLIGSDEDFVLDEQSGISKEDQQEILEVSHQWISSKNFLTQRMEGLTRVGESSLVIEPLEDTELEDAEEY